MTNTTPSLRDQISQDISRAIDSTVNYSGEEYEQNRHNWVQITTDRAIAALMSALPSPIDIQSKYELRPGEALPVRLVDTDEDEGHNQQQLDHLTLWSADMGYNRYYFEFTDYLKSLYSMTEGVVQSDHEHSESRTQQEDSDQSDNQEPSKVR